MLRRCYIVRDVDDVVLRQSVCEVLVVDELDVEAEFRRVVMCVNVVLELVFDEDL